MATATAAAAAAATAAEAPESSLILLGAAVKKGSVKSCARIRYRKGLLRLCTRTLPCTAKVLANEQQRFAVTKVTAEAFLQCTFAAVGRVASLRCSAKVGGCLRAARLHR